LAQLAVPNALRAFLEPATAQAAVGLLLKRWELLLVLARALALPFRELLLQDHQQNRLWC
jgi:hypothetical protein